MVTPEEVRKLAGLARLSVTDEEAAARAQEMTRIIEYVSAVQEAVGADETHAPIAPAHRNILREDGEPRARDTYTDAALAAAPRTEGRYLAVKKVLP